MTKRKHSVALRIEWVLLVGCFAGGIAFGFVHLVTEDFGWLTAGLFAMVPVLLIVYREFRR